MNFSKKKLEHATKIDDIMQLYQEEERRIWTNKRPRAR